MATQMKCECRKCKKMLWGSGWCEVCVNLGCPDDKKTPEPYEKIECETCEGDGLLDGVPTPNGSTYCDVCEGTGHK